MQRFRRARPPSWWRPMSRPAAWISTTFRTSFNYDLPLRPKPTCIASAAPGAPAKTGVAISLVTPDENWRLLQDRALYPTIHHPADLPTVRKSRHGAGSVAGEAAGLAAPRRCRREKEIVVELVEAGHDPLTSPVALKMGRSEENSAPIAEIREVNQSRPAAAPQRPSAANTMTARTARDANATAHRGASEPTDASKTVTRVVPTKKAWSV